MSGMLRTGKPREAVEARTREFLRSSKERCANAAS